MVFLPCWCFRLFITLLLLDTLLATDIKGDCIRPKKIKFAELSIGKMKESYRVGSTLTYDCLQGYEPIPGVIPQIMCSVSSEWIPESPRFCQGKKCPSPDLENGKVITTADLRLGDRITFACDHGYRLVGQKTSRCRLIGKSVKWDHLPTCKRISCLSPPEVMNGRNIGMHKASYGYGSKITFICDHGYYLVGNETLTCRGATDRIDGKWDSLVPQCKEVRCPKPEIENGNFDSFDSSYKHGHFLKVKCKNKYVLSGARRIKCGGDKNWHPTLPKCVRGSAATGTAEGGTGTGTRTDTSTRTDTGRGVSADSTTMPVRGSALPGSVSERGSQFQQPDYTASGRSFEQREESETTKKIKGTRSLTDHLNDIEEKVDKILRKVDKSEGQYEGPPGRSEASSEVNSEGKSAARSGAKRADNSEANSADNSEARHGANSASRSEINPTANSEVSSADNSASKTLREEE